LRALAKGGLHRGDVSSGIGVWLRLPGELFKVAFSTPASRGSAPGLTEVMSRQIDGTTRYLGHSARLV